MSFKQKIGVSSIAWDQKDDAANIHFLSNIGIKFLEIIPYRILTNKSFYRNLIKKEKFQFIAAQALLFGTQELHLFQTQKQRDMLFTYFKKLLNLAEEFNIPSLIFGSPSNRKFDSAILAQDMAERIALDFFSELSKYASQTNTTICIEPNPISYGTNFLNTSMETYFFLKKLNSPYIKMNLDLGSLILNQENIVQILETVWNYIGHIHLSAPGLEIPLKSQSHIEQLKELYNFLKEKNASKIISIEVAKQKHTPFNEWLPILLDTVENTYENI